MVYKLSPKTLVRMNSKDRQDESCSAAEIRRGSKTVFYSTGCEEGLVDEQREFFLEVDNEDSEFMRGRWKVPNLNDFKTAANLVIADATPERKFVRELTVRDNAQKVSGWFKNASMGFYTIEYAWKKGEHPKRGEFSPDFFIKQGNDIFVVEIKGDEEINDPFPENIKKYEYAADHFEQLNAWLKRAKVDSRYQFNMLSPRSYNIFFQKLKEGGLIGFRSELDIVMRRSE